MPEQNNSSEFTPQLPEARKDIVSVSLHNEQVILDTISPLYDPHEIGLPRKTPEGIYNDVVAEADLNDAGGNFAFIKNSTPEGDQYYAVNLIPGKEGARQAAGSWHPLPEGVPVVFGRDPSADVQPSQGASYGAKISRKHLSAVVSNGQLMLTDSSMNGSTYKGNPFVASSKYGFSAEHTVTADEKAELTGLLRLNEASNIKEFRGRPTIGRTTFPIDGHVDIRAWVAGGEAIVVDSKKYPQEFDKLRSEFLAKLEKTRDPKLTPEQQVLMAIYGTVDKAMKYDEKYVQKVSDDVQARGTEHRSVSLNTYLYNKKGVCRHTGLAVSWLGGEANRLGFLQGRFTTEVNQSNQGIGAHEWSRFTPDDGGDPYIIDVAQKFVGKLADTLPGVSNARERWGYFLSQEEYDTYLNKRNGRAILALGGDTPMPSTQANRIITPDDVPKS